MENGQGPKTKQKKRSAKKVAQILERGTRILELRKNGASLRQISSILKKQAEEKGEPTRGYSYEQVRKDWLEILHLRISEQQEVVEEIRALCAERLDEVILQMSPLLRSKDLEYKAQAANAIIRASKEYAELYGAKAPQSVKVGGTVSAYIMTKEEWESKATNRLAQVRDQLEKFDDNATDNTDDPDTPSDAVGSVLGSLLGNRN
jgi:DNA-binding transcriptional MerR regulator